MKSALTGERIAITRGLMPTLLDDSTNVSRIYARTLSAWVMSDLFGESKVYTAIE